MAGALSFLKEATSRNTNTTNIVLLPLNQTRYGCHNHRDSKGRKYTESIVFVNTRDLEFVCTCGTIYRRSKDYVAPENNESKTLIS